ncbi:MAG: HAD family hydrolase [Desulfotomaculales bacterium]
MLRVAIPGRGELVLAHVVLDFNGTFACDGRILPGVAGRLRALAGDLSVHILTADTFGTAQEACREVGGEVVVLREPLTGPEKASYVEKLGAGSTVAIGNGANDAPMLRRAALGIVVVGPEGAAVEALQAADIVVREINDALDLLLKPKRLVATLRR